MFCWLYKFMISNTVDSENALSGMTRRHIRGCLGCRAFYETCLSLAEGLRGEAAALDEDLPAHFAQRVFDTASTGTGRPLKLPVRWLRPALAAACIMILALTGVVFLTAYDADPAVDKPPQIGFSSLVDDGHPTAWAGFVGRPLSREIDNLADGTESAVRFLVACVAVSPAKTGYEPPN